MARRKAPVPRMADLCALLLRDYELHGRRSIRRARAALAHLLEHFDEVDPATTFERTMRYAAARRLEAGASTVRYEIALLGRSLKLAARSGWIPTVPYLFRPTVRVVRQGFVSPAEIARLLPHLPEPIRGATLFAYVTGWRRAEVFGLRWEHVDMEEGVCELHADRSKNGEARAFPFRAHPQLRRMLELRAMEPRRGPYVFGREHGGPVVTFDRTWKTACERAGMGHTLFHDLRRSAVRNMERAGVPRTVAMRLIGHKTESIYRRYAITNEDDLARGVRLIAESDRKGRRGREAKEEEEPRSGGARQEALEGRAGRGQGKADASGCKQPLEETEDR